MKLALPYKDIRKVLVRGVNWIGDTVITLPSIKGIRSVFPDAYIAVLLYPHLSSLFGRCAFVDEVIPYPRARGFNLFLEERVLVKSIRQKQFDLAVILPRSFRSALIPYLARIPYRIGYNACQRGMLLTHRLKEKEKVLNCHQVEYYYHLVQSLGVAQPYELPNLFLGREEKGWAHRFL
ncbi:MAG: glycosyltransferase family 9 protein, partial [Deltaproteobacteria bacterium]|nr:glycosyltransferase family 9 protein [Deltaproteobacteria bacterium]